MELELEERSVTLAELLDVDSLQRLCMTFARLYDIGLAVIDAGGQLMVDVPAELPICRRIRASRLGQDVCGAFDYLARGPDASVGEAPVAEHCTCGLRYEVLVLRHKEELLGRLVYGPYKPEGMERLSVELEKMLTEAATPDKEAFDGANAELDRMPARNPEKVMLQVSSIRELLSVVVQTGYARHLTSQIHIAAIQDAYEELQEKNRRLADSVERLKELDKLRSSFLATFSHELRTPLTSIIGYSEMLLEGLVGKLVEDQEKYVHVIMDKGNHLLRMINEILDISKIQSGTVQLCYEEFRVGQLIEQVVSGMEPQARRKQVTLSYDVPGDLPALHGDRSKIRQVLLNLLSNGLKFTRDGGTVIVSAEPTQIAVGVDGARVPAIEMRVSDNGIGIPRDNWQLVFEAFYQVDSTSTREYGGTGLGLSIVKQFIEAHHGQVGIVESSDQGTTIALQLPLKPPQGKAAEA